MSAVGACFVGLDLGTSGCRAIAIDADARVVAESRAALPPSRHPAPGASEQDPADWWSAVVEVLGSLVARTGPAVAGIAVDGTSSTLLLCTADGTPCGPALMYDDRRAAAQADLIARHAPPDSPARGPGSALAKLMAMLADRAPAGARHAVHQADWITGHLLGRHGHSDENNALKLGYDPVAQRWPAWLAALAIDLALLPRVTSVGSVLGPVAPDLARGLGLPPSCMVVAGTTDSNAATLAAGIRRRGEAVTSLGSTLVLKVLSDRPLFAARFGVYSHRLGDHWLVGGASNSGGCVVRQYFSDARVAELTRFIDPDHPSGLGYYPLPAVGERFPANDPGKPPVLTPRPASDALFLQGILEGIADIEQRGYRLLERLGAPYPKRVFTSGGGAVNAAWSRIRRRCLGVPVLRAAQAEAAYGAALLARGAAGDARSAL